MDTKKQEEIKKKWLQIVEKARKDEHFKQRLVKNPDLILKEEGLDLPENMHAKIYEEKSNTRYLILPEQPEQARHK